MNEIPGDFVNHARFFATATYFLFTGALLVYFRSFRGTVVWRFFTSTLVFFGSLAALTAARLVGPAEGIMNIVSVACLTVIGLSLIWMTKNLGNLRSVLLHEKEKARTEARVQTSRDFVAMVTHELRTPLTSILGAADTLRNVPNLTEDMKDELIKMVAEQSERLSRMVNDVLVTSTLDAQSVDLLIEPVDVSKLLETTLSTRRELLSGQEVVITQAIEPGLTANVDSERLQQVIHNLVENAIKYSPKGGIVHAYITKENGTICMAVEDYGLGIPSGMLPRVFEKFYRLPVTKETSGIEGTGLGLYISKKLVEAMGGAISVESVVGKGSTFKVTLPECRAATLK